MAKQAESKLSSKIMASLRAAGYWCFKVHGSALQMSGIPDILVCADGIFIGLETKMPDKRSNVSPRQELVMGEIGAAGGYCSVICSEVEAMEYVESILRGRG